MKKMSILLLFLAVPLFSSCNNGDESPISEKSASTTDDFSLEKLGKYISYVKADDAVYWVDEKKKRTKIEGVDVTTFEILNHWYNKDYARDKNKVYLIFDNIGRFSLIELYNANPESFQILEGDFSKDKNTVYWQGKDISEADSNTFQAMKFSYGKDKNHVFRFNLIIDDADPATISVDDQYPNISRDNKYLFKYIPGSTWKKFEKIDKNNEFSPL